MIPLKDIEKLITKYQAVRGTIIREYCQHLFLSFLYEAPMSGHLLFKGGTALRIVLKSPRFSEDLDFDGYHIRFDEIEAIIEHVLGEVEKMGIGVSLGESKKTTGGHIMLADFTLHEEVIQIKIEISLRDKYTQKEGTLALIESEYIPDYNLIHLALPLLIQGKLDALFARQKPRDFYDFFFLLSANYPEVKNRDVLEKVRTLTKETDINFRAELAKFLPASQSMILRDFKTTLLAKINQFLG
ncbi:MAG: nucleotidyl transferase AbiEii/AbiGii toxin family protein [bacterium]|nr:nucleotidyl transferase AbiEii/AbiGii toxin family protein [bacterium]